MITVLSPAKTLDESPVEVLDVQSPRLLHESTQLVGVLRKKSVDDIRQLMNVSEKIATLNGTGISLNSLWSVHSELRSGQLVRVLPEWQADTQSALWLVYPTSNVISVKVRVFIDFLLEHFERGRDWSAP